MSCVKPSAEYYSSGVSLLKGKWNVCDSEVTLPRTKSQLYHLQLPTQGKRLVSHFSPICDVPFKLQLDAEGEQFTASVPFDGDWASKEGKDTWLLMQTF